jgi:hypothetical protein
MVRFRAKSPCPSCGYGIDAATPATEDDNIMPETGDVSICFNCGVLLIFTSDEGALRLATQSETDEVLRDYPYMRGIAQGITRRTKSRSS